MATKWTTPEMPRAGVFEPFPPRLVYFWRRGRRLGDDYYLRRVLKARQKAIITEAVEDALDIMAREAHVVRPQPAPAAPPAPTPKGNTFPAKGQLRRCLPIDESSADDQPPTKKTRN